MLPTITVKGRYDDRFGPSKFTDESETSSMVGRATIPIYEAGDVYGRVRQEKQNPLRLLQQSEHVRTEQTHTVLAFGSQLEAARGQLESDRVAVESNKVALQG